MLQQNRSFHEKINACTDDNRNIKSHWFKELLIAKTFGFLFLANWKNHTIECEESDGKKRANKNK